MEAVDERLRASDKRKRDYSIEQRNQEKSLATTIGPVAFERTYFKDKRTKSHVFLVDQMLGIEPHQRILQELASCLLTSATETSYQKTIDRYAYSGITSRTAVMRLVHRFGKIESSELPLLHKKKEVAHIYVEADEDHVTMQDGSNQQMKLIYVHEGHKRVNNKRRELVNPRFFTGFYKKSSDELWYEVLSYLDEAYDLDQVEEITLSGDGAPWIQMGVHPLPKCRFYLDKFHLEKALRKAASPIDALKGTKDHYYWFLKDAIRLNSKDDVRMYFDSTIGLPLMNSQKKALQQMRTYLISNWAAIQNTQRTEYHGCSAEDHVSHVVSSRLSSRPMGWSETGAENIARMRAYQLNSGDLREYFFAKEKQKKKEARLIKLKKGW